jgi:xylulokinase
LLRALIEGVSFSLRDCLSIIHEDMGIEISNVRVSGGGAKSLFWRQMLADIFSTSVATLANTEGSAYGAALLALAGDGPYASVEDVCATAIKEVSRVVPVAHDSAVYQRGYEVFSVLYPTLKPIYGLIHQMA